MILLSAFGGGLWIIPLGVLLGSLFSFYKAWRNRNSGWEQQTPQGTIGGPEKLPYTKVPAFYYAVALFVAFIAIVILMINER